MPEDNLHDILAQIRRDIQSIPAAAPKETAPRAPERPARQEAPPAVRPPLSPPEEDFPDRELYESESEDQRPQERYSQKSFDSVESCDADSSSLRSGLWIPLGQTLSMGLAAIAAYREDFTLLALSLAGFVGALLAGALLPKGSTYTALRSAERRLENVERRLDSLKFSSGGVSNELEEEIKELRGILRSLVGSLEGPKNGT